MDSSARKTKCTNCDSFFHAYCAKEANCSFKPVNGVISTLVCAVCSKKMLDENQTSFQGGARGNQSTTATGATNNGLLYTQELRASLQNDIKATVADAIVKAFQADMMI